LKTESAMRRRLVGGIKVFERRPSTELGAVRRNVDRIERRRPANEQAVELGAAESDVRDHFGNEDFAGQRAVAVIAMEAFGVVSCRLAMPIIPEKGDIPVHPRRVPHGIAIIFRFLDLRNRGIRIEGRCVKFYGG
jgi:hypothetical protein